MPAKRESKKSEPNDYVAVDLGVRKIAHFVAVDMGRPGAAKAARAMLKR